MNLLPDQGPLIQDFALLIDAFEAKERENFNLT